MSPLGIVLFLAGCCGLGLAAYSAALKQVVGRGQNYSGEAVTAFWSTVLVIAGCFA